MNIKMWPFPRPKEEVMLVILGVDLGIFLYYSRHPLWSCVGFGILTCTAFYAAISLRYINSTSLAALHITGKNWGLYLLIGLILIFPGWFFDSMYSYLSGKGWIPLRITTSPVLILSIIAIAISEDIFFRGYLLGRLKFLGLGRWKRVILTGTLFMCYKVLVHSWEGWPLIYFAEFFAVGVMDNLFGTFWTDWTGSVVTYIVVHIGWDIIMFQNYSSLPYWAL